MGILIFDSFLREAGIYVFMRLHEFESNGASVT